MWVFSVIFGEHKEMSISLCAKIEGLSQAIQRTFQDYRVVLC